MLPGKRATTLIGIDDQRGRGKRGRRQVMIGDQHLDAERRRRSDAVVARDAVVDGHDEARRERGRLRDDLRREPVAVFESVRHEEIDDGAHRREPAHPDRAGGGAVGVVVGDDHDLLAVRGSHRRAARRRRRCLSSSRTPATSRARCRSSSALATPREANTRASTGWTPAAVKRRGCDRNGAAHDVHQTASFAASSSAPRSRAWIAAGDPLPQSGWARVPDDGVARVFADERHLDAASPRRVRRGPGPPMRARVTSASSARSSTTTIGFRASPASSQRVAQVRRARRRNGAARVRGERAMRSRLPRMSRSPAPSRCRGASVPPSENQRLFTGARPVRSRSTLTGCSWSSISISDCQRRQSAASGPCGSSARNGSMDRGARRTVESRVPVATRTKNRSGRGATKASIVVREMRVQRREQRVGLVAREIVDDTGELHARRARLRALQDRRRANRPSPGSTPSAARRIGASGQSRLPDDAVVRRQRRGDAAALSRRATPASARRCARAGAARPRSCRRALRRVRGSARMSCMIGGDASARRCGACGTAWYARV